MLLLVISAWQNNKVDINADVKAIRNLEDQWSSDLGYARGASRVKKTTPKGPVEIRTKWVDIWKKTDGKWKVVVNISYSDNPLAGR